MKILNCGDTHYDLNDGELKRTDDIDRTFNTIISEAIEQEVDVFVHNGDVFDNNRPTSDSIAKFIRTCNRLERERIETYILVGNHDIISQAGRTSVLEVIDAIDYKYVSVIKNPTVKSYDNGVSLMFLPHVAKAHLIEKGYSNIENFWDETIEELLGLCKPTTFAFAHHNISGAVSGSEAWMVKGDEQILPDLLFENRKVKYVFDGHIHKPQVIKKKKSTVVIVGSVECLNMGEKDEDKKYVIVEV